MLLFPAGSERFPPVFLCLRGGLQRRPPFFQRGQLFEKPLQKTLASHALGHRALADKIALHRGDLLR